MWNPVNPHIGTHKRPIMTITDILHYVKEYTAETLTARQHFTSAVQTFDQAVITSCGQEYDF